MRKLDKLTGILAAAILGASALAGCSSAEASTHSTAASEASTAQSDATEASSSESTDSASEDAAEQESATSEEAAEASDAEETIVRIGDQPSFFILKIAEQQGFFEEEFAKDNITISVDNYVNQGSAIVEAMNAGDEDLGVIGALPLVAADANGSNFVALSSVNISENGFKLFAAPGSDVQKVEDFEGKKVAVKFSSNEHQMLLTLLANAGLSPETVEVVNMSAEDSLNSLINGDVDGAILKGDQLQAANDNNAIVIADNSESGVIANYLIGRQQFVEENPEIVQRVIQVLEKTKQWIDENPDETVSIFVSLTGADEASAKSSFESRDRSISIDAPKLADPIQKSIDFSKEQGIITADITADDIIDTSYYIASGVSED